MNIHVMDLRDSLSEQTQGFQRIQIFNATNTDNEHISLEYVVLPTGAESVPHAHISTHTVVFTIKGSVRIYYGEQLEHQLKVNRQQSVYIPPGIVHHVVNEEEEDMIAVVARTPSQHQVEEYPHLLEAIQQFTHDKNILT